MKSEQKKPEPKQADPRGSTGTREPETTPDQERGERLDTGKTIARGGKAEGHVPGAEPSQPE